MARDVDNRLMLLRALDQTTGIIAAIPADRAAAATPCPAWDVRALVRHLVGQGLRNFIAAARDETADWRAPADELGEYWAADFREREAQLMIAWREADPDRMIAMPGGGQAPLGARADQQIAELTVHGWDLVKATGQQADLDPVLAEHALGWSRQMLRPEFRGPGKMCGPEVIVDPGAPSYDRLAGWFGRDPGWTPEGPTT